jgi:hypothetical protein
MALSGQMAREDLFLATRRTRMADIPQWWMKGDWFDV